ncbi:hypothetical protein GCM10011571_35560 [Marinithermofilum abyssi]|uniref:CvpA family protein n=1 Tax=Marinithermofilum abyssi TaxID=1571185 RepID=A0A8J2VL41_9BACL|nr:CvpA family protein [Marinithermofilum abyssi]GGE30225.1 hypothetical protein GCM10011571_35560 [Marinithermofilum abyssi]
MVLDLIFVFLALGGLIRGYQKGVIREAAALVGVLVAAFIAWQFSSYVAPSLKGIFTLPKSWTSGPAGLLPVETIVYNSLAFLLLFLLTWGAVSFIAFFLTELTNLPVLSQINGVGGAVVGFAKALLVMMITVNLLQLIPWTTGQQAVRKSALCQGILEITPDLTDTWKKSV